MHIIRRCLPLLVIVALLAVLAGTADACPTCKDGMEHDPAAMTMARGYYLSILFMMSMPFLILFGVGGYFYWEVRKARARKHDVVESLA